MEKIVFFQPTRKEKLFTTSLIIAKHAHITHHAVQVLIQKYKNDLKEFGKVSFEMRASESSKTNQSELVYHLNEEQATLIMTYLKNTAPVRQFKKELVRQFFEMREALLQQQAAKVERKPIRRSLTDAIKADPQHSKWDFPLYTDLAYRTTIGQTARQIRKEHGAGKSVPASDFLTAKQIQKISKLESQIAVLKEFGMGYQEVKSLISNHTMATRGPVR